jgi:cobyrinic acid a,c-diamide synthase
MLCLPRLALATPGAGSEPSAAGLGLLAGLSRKGWRVQHFVSRARPIPHGRLDWAGGLPTRHLDAWLMSPEVCREVFARGARRAELAVVEGTLDEVGLAPGRRPYDRPGRLGPLAEALDLPVIALVDCRDGLATHLPRLPQAVDAILLDNLEDRSAYPALRQMVGLILKRPVLGAVEALPQARAALLREGPRAQEALERLADSFLRFADLRALRALARSRPFPEPLDLLPLLGEGRRFRVAYAQDEAFGGYFPDTLETLEALGAELVEFSPLRDEALPEAVDLVMIGCGYPDRHADALAGNHCLIAALRTHVCRGHRIYSEGGGTAYLGRTLILGRRQVPGAGILPFDAKLRTNPTGPTPVSRTLTRDGWLGPRGTVVRGYRSGRWQLLPAPEPDDCPAKSGPLTDQRDIYFRKHAVGSLVHLHLASLPQVVSAFAGPHLPSLVPPRVRR